jgi:hypothetical protein
MLSSDHSLSRRTVLISVGAAAALFLAGCSSFAPVYSGQPGADARLELSYGEPRDRLEQIVHQELALAFGRSTAPSAALVRTAVTSVEGPEGLSATPGNESRSLTLTATMTISPRDGSGQPTTVTRSTTTSYQSVGQGLSDQEARIDAEERAARAVADSLRLALLATRR